MYTNVNRSSIPSSQKVETVHMPVTEAWRDQRWSIHTAEYYSAIERNEVPINSADLENIMVCERRQAHETGHILYDSVSLQCPESVSPLREDADGWLQGDKGKGECLLTGGRVSFWGNEYVSQRDKSCWLHDIVSALTATKLFTLQWLKCESHVDFLKR